MYLEEFDNFRPKDFLKLSQKLNKIHDDFPEITSASNRTIMSRVYYAAFLYVREWVKIHLSYISNPGKDHRQLPNFIVSKGPFSEEKNKRIGGFLKTLKRLRQQADYEIKLPKKGTYEYNMWGFIGIDKAFEMAEEIFDAFENLE